MDQLTSLPEDMLPDEVREALALQKAQTMEQIKALGEALAGKRDEAVRGRAGSDIEAEWTEAEESYQGIDDANRGEAKTGKPSSPNGGFTTSKPVNQTTRSTAYLNITRPYVDAAAARVADMLLPTDDTPWAIEPTPIPEVKSQYVGNPVAEPRQLGMPQAPVDSMLPGQELVMPGQGGQPAQQGPLATKTTAIADAAKKAAEGATKQIEDWLVECQWHAEVRKVIEDCARLGTGVLKGPTPCRRTSRSAVTGPDGSMTLQITQKIAPESRRIDPRNLFPEPSCGESIHEGSYVWERDSITAKQLRDLKGLDYLDDQIDHVLKEGPGKKYADGQPVPNGTAEASEKYEIWYFHGSVDREDMKAAGIEDLPDEGDVSIPAIVTMVNDCVIKAAINPLDSGEFPYDVMPWQRRSGMPWGTGVAKQINTPQRMLNASVRNMLDNAGLSAGPQIIVRRAGITPADGVWAITPRKIWFVDEGADIQNPADAFHAVDIPTMQVELNNIIQFALKMAEDVTGLPMLMQGQGGEAPDTVGGMTMLSNNASTVLRRLARTFDATMTEPHITRYYEWLLMYGEDPSIKGDYQIDARGSSALVERDLQNQAILQMGALVKDPAFEVDPAKWFAEACKAQRLDPKRFQMDEEKKAKMAQQPPPPQPQIEVAKIRAQADLLKNRENNQVKQQIAQVDAQVDMQRIQKDTDRDTAYVQAEAARTQATQEAKLQELAMKRELAMLEYANQRQQTLEQVKADLAQTAMKLNTQRELAQMDAHAKQVLTPPTEPPGRAPDGQAYQR